MCAALSAYSITVMPIVEEVCMLNSLEHLPAMPIIEELQESLTSEKRHQLEEAMYEPDVPSIDAHGSSMEATHASSVQSSPPPPPPPVPDNIDDILRKVQEEEDIRQWKKQTRKQNWESKDTSTSWNADDKWQAHSSWEPSTTWKEGKQQNHRTTTTRNDQHRDDWKSWPAWSADDRLHDKYGDSSSHKHHHHPREHKQRGRSPSCASSRSDRKHRRRAKCAQDDRKRSHDKYDRQSEREKEWRQSDAKHAKDRRHRSPLARVRRQDSLSDFKASRSDIKMLSKMAPKDVPQDILDKFGSLMTAADRSISKHVHSISPHPDMPEFVRFLLKDMPGPEFMPQDKEEITIYLFHATSLKGAISILRGGCLKTMPDYDKQHMYAIYGKGIILTGDAQTDRSEVSRVLQKMTEFPKNQCNVIFQVQATGLQKKLTSGGVEAEERHLQRHKRHLVHMISGKTNRWTVHPDNQRLKAVWALGDIWDFQQYDPFE